MEKAEHCIKTAKFLVGMSKRARLNNKPEHAALHLNAAANMRKNAALFLAQA